MSSRALPLFERTGCTCPLCAIQTELRSAAESGRHAAPLRAEVVALFDEFREPLLRYLASFGLALPDREDVIQEVFLALFRHLQRGRSRQHLRGWLFRVAHNQALRRRMRNRRDFEARITDAEQVAVEPGAGPEGQAVERQAQRVLMGVVAALPEQDRRCLFLRADGLRYREIASVLDMSLGAVSLSLARSLGKMARAVER